MKSMTGFGKGAATVNEFMATVEVSSINSKRQLELRCSLPREILPLEPEIRAVVQKRIARGTLSLTVTYRAVNASGCGGSVINGELAESVLKSLREFASANELPEPTLRDVLLVPGVVQEAQLSPDQAKDAIFAALDQALAELDKARVTEGGNLKAELDLRRQNMQNALDKIKAREQEAVIAMRDRIRERIAALGVEIPVDDERLAREVAFYVDKADITEETVRLQSHLAQYAVLLEAASDAGRNFDFLVQEMCREANTLSAKTADSIISGDALELKIELSKVKEQIANIE